jgi:hypothetical protein
MIRCSLLVALVTSSCSWLPPDPPAAKPVPPDPDLVAIVHAWTIENHVLTARSALGDLDAGELHGRAVDVTVTGYVTPWQGTCETAERKRHDRIFADLITELGLSTPARNAVIRFGVGDPIVEYTLSCVSSNRTPPLVLYLSGKRGMSCFNGVCYLLTRK